MPKYGKMGKQKSAGYATFAKGGSTKMHGKQTAGSQKSGQTAQMGSGGGKFAAGGNTKMHGKQTASPQKPGQTAQK